MLSARPVRDVATSSLTITQVFYADVAKRVIMQPWLRRRTFLHSSGAPQNFKRLLAAST
ncbi:MAG: hypothetical protein ACRD3Q_10670 [Terriglobales bacterium]